MLTISYETKRGAGLVKTVTPDEARRLMPTLRRESLLRLNNEIVGRVWRLDERTPRGHIWGWFIDEDALRPLVKPTA